MMRIAGVHIYKNFNSNYIFQSVRKICVNSCLQVNKSKAEELAEKKRKDQEIRWTKLYHFTDIKYHSIVTRLKIYPYISTVILTPIAYLFEFSQKYPEFTAEPCLIIGKCCSILKHRISK